MSEALLCFKFPDLMEVGLMDNEHGSIKISDDVIAVCAARAALETQGVYSFASAVFTDAISESLLGKIPESKGVKVNQNDDEVVIDLYIIVRYGIKIPSVAWNIQENVKHEVEKFSGLKVSYVNIHVQGIHFNDKNETSKKHTPGEDKDI
jgi:uncharacterized alkaline shock family protein YloU